MMKRFFAASTLVLTLAACGGDAGPTDSQRQRAVLAEPAAPLAHTVPSGSLWSIFTSETPTTTPNATVEVGTQFFTTQPGAVIGLRFWQAPGESGTHLVTLWSSSGVQLATRTISTTGSGWKTAYFTGILGLGANQYYLVSVNINSQYVRTPGAYTAGPIINGPLVATAGFYGTTVGSMPNRWTTNNYFVDVVFEAS